MEQWGTRRGESLGFMSRRAVAHAEWHKPRVSRHAFLELAPNGGSWRAYGVHLSAVHAAWTERRRVFELHALLRSIARRQPGPQALVGDFNTLAPGELLDIRQLPYRLRALVWLSGGHVRWRTIQTVLDAGYADAFRHLHPNLVGSTFPPRDPHVRLDYLFVPSDSVAMLSIRIGCASSATAFTTVHTCSGTSARLRKSVCNDFSARASGMSPVSRK